MHLLKIVPRLTVNVVALIIRIARLLATIVVFYVIYKLLLDQFLDGSAQIYPFLGLWLLSSYIVIPKINRILTRYYLPNYFVGRVRSPDGLLSDPVNLSFIASEADLHNAMEAAGWTRADTLTFKSLFDAVYCSVVKKSYPKAPVGNMYMFNRRQDFAYEQEVGGSPNERHHIRFWKTPDTWYMPGGRKADWLAAASYDKKVGIKLASGQIDHIIHENIDEERDYIQKSLEDAKMVKKTEIIEHFTDAYHDRNNGGDRIKTDGSLPFIWL